MSTYRTRTARTGYVNCFDEFGRIQNRPLSSAIAVIVRVTGVSKETARYRIRRFANDFTRLYSPVDIRKRRAARAQTLDSVCAELDARKRELEAKK